MDDLTEDDLEPGLIVAEEPGLAAPKRGLVTFLLYLAMFTIGLSGALVYKNINYKKEVAAKSELVPKKVSDLALNSILSENFAYMFNPNISSNKAFFEDMAANGEEDIRFLYMALASIYAENNTRDVFVSVENYSEDFDNNTFSAIVHLGFLDYEDGDYHFENLSKEGFFRVESFSDYTSANDYFNKNSKNFNAFKFNYRILDSGVYLKNIENIK